MSPGPTAEPDRDDPVTRSGLDAAGRPGESATSIEYRVDAERTVGLLARTLARLHATELDAAESATPLSAERLAARAVAALAAGAVRDKGRSAAYRHVTAERLVAILGDGARRADERRDRWVLTHGAPTLAHLWCERGSAVGLIGWTDPAVADPYRDLAVAARSVATDLTPALVPLLFEAYGERTPDPVRVDWYTLAAELLVPAGADPG